MKWMNAITLAFAVALPLGAGAQSACALAAPALALQQVNAVRAQGAVCGTRGGLAPAGELSWNKKLEDMAREQALWMADFGMLVHAGREGQTLSQRAVAAGYSFGRVTENLAHGQTGLAQALASWTASEGHCVNLYDSGVTEMALACVKGPGGRPFWVLVMGRAL